MPASLFLFLLLAQRVLLIDDVYAIPRGDWRYVELGLQQQAATVECDFHVVAGGSGVRVALVTHHDLNRFREGRSHDILATTNFERAGRLRFRVLQPGLYALVVDNRMEGRGEARVALRVFLDFATPAAQPAIRLSPRRKWTVIAISVLGFLAVAAPAARRILRAFHGSAA